MTKTINTAKYERYIKFNRAWDLLEELDNSQYSNRVNFQTADEALAFLKVHTNDNSFEREATTSAIIKAITYLEELETQLKCLMIEGLAEDERRKKIAQAAHEKARKLFNEKLEPAFKELVSQIDNLNTITGYSSYFLKNDFENIVRNLQKSARISS